jgi:hypothetical protein
MACYGDSFSVLYVADVCTSLEAHAFTTCYGDSFTFFLLLLCGAERYTRANHLCSHSVVPQHFTEPEGSCKI